MNMGFRSVRFVSPARANDKIRARIKLKESKSIRGNPKVVWNIHVEAARNRLPVAVMDWVVGYRESTPPVVVDC